MIGAIPSAPLPPPSGAGATRGADGPKRGERAAASGDDDRARAGFALALLAWIGQPVCAAAAVIAPDAGIAGSLPGSVAPPVAPKIPLVTAPSLELPPVAAPLAPAVTAPASPKPPAVAGPLEPVVTAPAGPKAPAVHAPLAPVAPVVHAVPGEPAPIVPAWPELVPVADPAGPPSGAPVATPAPSPSARGPVAVPNPAAPAREEGDADPRGRRGDAGSAMLRAARRTGRVGGPLPVPVAVTSRAGAPPVTAVKFAELTPPGTPPVRVPASAAGFEAPSMRAWEARLAGRTTPGDAVVMRLEDEAGGAGSLRLQVRGESLLATLRTDDAALAGRLGRDLGELEQSLRERGIERTRIQVTGPAAGPEVPSGRREAGRNETPTRRDERSSSRRDEDPRRNSRSQERNPR